MSDGLWTKLDKLCGQELHTLEKGNPFSILEITEGFVIIEVGTTKERRKISREALESTWKQLVSQKELSRAEIHSHNPQRNSARVAAILAAVPGVTHQKKPIRLFYSTN
jgi:hypothetical protein